jgi:pSer/pThr/pTyr-binding forkhead associated (FHA) protein
LSDVAEGYDLAGDSDVDLAHAQLTLQVTKKLPTVVVTDLKSSAGTRVEKYLLQSGKSQKAFLNNIITIGETGIKVLPLKARNTSMGSVGHVEIMNVPDVDMLEATEKENSTPAEKGLMLALVEGASNAPSMYLRPGEAKIVGSKGDFVVNGADPSHLKLTLHVTRQMMSIQVKDLRSKSGTFINGNKVQEGKLFIGDSLKVGDCTWKVTKDDGDLKQPGMKMPNVVACRACSRVSSRIHCWST